MIQSRNITGGKGSKARSVTDAYFTPQAVVQSFLNHPEAPPKECTIWEPACGAGVMSECLKKNNYSVISSDLHQYGYKCVKQDFLAVEPINNHMVDAIVTNPPYRDAEAFIRKALMLSPYVAMFLRLSFLEGQARSKGLWKDYPPHRVLVMGKRPTLYVHGTEAPKNGGVMAYAWFIWKRGSEEAKIEWI
jgi:hypothetical protein